MASLKEYRDVRLAKLEALKALGVDPYPATSKRDTTLRAVAQQYEELEGKPVVVAGRVLSVREHGQLEFIDVKDATGQVQLYIHAEDLAEVDHGNSELAFGELHLLDEGDFVEAAGAVTKTKTGQISVAVKSLRLLTKSLRPMPFGREGLKDKETRIRRRYLDTNANPEVYERFLRRSKFWQATRDFLNGEGFVEINTPVLELTTGGADANPFVTHMDALDQDFYLRISHELPLKRLLVGGYEKVFDIGPRFRNENYSDEHLPEHVAMEWYWAYADWDLGMELTQRLVRTVVDATWQTRKFTLATGEEVNLGADSEDWPRISFVDVIREHYGLDVFTCTLAQVQEQLKKHGIEVEKHDNRSRGIDKLWKKVRGTLAGPAFLVDIPTFLQPLAKVQPGRPELTEQFNLILGGTELCKAYSELNDPVDQLNRFVEQQQMRDAGDNEAMMLDLDYVEALEYGMPPACGFGYSERVFWMLEGVTAREGVVFPQLRREIDEVTKGLYPELKLEATGSAGSGGSLADLPVSAAEQGTKKLYLDDYSLLECEAEVAAVEDLGEGSYRLVLDQTCLYPGGGGQDFDLGTIKWKDGRLELHEVSKDKEGVVYHDGVLEGDAPAVGAKVHCVVDKDRRLLNSRLHCAGHLIDYAVRQIEPDWQPGRGSHYPGRCYVEYGGVFDADKAEAMAREIEKTLAKLVKEGGPITSRRVLSMEAREHSDYIPEAILKLYQNVHIAEYPRDFKICCGGTHLTDVTQLGKVLITKIKKKDGQIRVSYEAG